MPLPSGVKVEVEFTAGTWTNITADVDYNQGWTEQVGRTSPLSTPQVSGVTIPLYNATGKYTPGLQVLTDGSTAPFWPNLAPGVRVRLSDSAGVTWVGDITAWQPLLDNGMLGRALLVAVDRLGRLGRVTMSGALAFEIATDSPAAWWPLTDPAGSTQGAEVSGHNRNPMLVTTGTLGGTPTFGDDGPGTEQGSGVLFSGSGNMHSTNTRSLTTASMTLEFWVRTAAATSTNFVGWVGTRDGALATYLSIAAGGGWLYDDGTGFGTIGPFGSGYNDDAWHHVAFTFDPAGSIVSLWVDGSILFSTFGSSWTFDYLAFGQNAFNGHIGQVAIYPAILSSARIGAHYNAGHGWAGETVDDRIGRFLGYAGMTSADSDLDTSTVALNSYAQGGVDVVTGAQDQATSESGGAAFYVLRGRPTFRNRYFRTGQASAFTVDASLALHRDQFAPSVDTDSMVNTATVNQATATTNAATFTIVNQASVTRYGTFTGPDITSYADDPLDVQRVGQWLTSGSGQPAYRLAQVTIDLLTATSDLYAAAQAVEIGTRFTVTNLPAGVAPRPSMDFYVEGWTRVRNRFVDTITFDTSPADYQAVYGSAVYQCSGQSLNAGITKTATTLAIKTTAGLPTFTTDGGQYPLDVTVGAEIITLSNAPGGSSSPQTFTGVTRGAHGTSPAAQASSSAVALSPTSTYTL